MRHIWHDTGNPLQILPQIMLQMMHYEKQYTVL